MFNNKSSDIAQSLINHASQSTDHVLEATHRITNNALEGASQSLQTAGKEICNSAHYASDRTAAYVRHQPVKSLLIAAAVGAALLGLAQMIGSPHRTR